MKSNSRVPFQLSSDRARVAPPVPGKGLIVHLCVAVEHWPFDKPLPRRMITPPHGMEPMPDVANFSWVEYGMRLGTMRILELFQRRGVPASTMINASVIDVYPTLAEAMLKAGWEFIGHGFVQRSLQKEPDERAAIVQSLERVRAFTGKPVRGWIGPGLHETVHTPELLKELGVDYVMDWVLDDLPCWITTTRGPLLINPYSFDLNDVVMYAVEQDGSPEILRRVEDSLEVLGREAREQPRVLPIGLHPYLMGVGHRFHYVERMLDALLARPDTVFMTGSQIADWWYGVDRWPG
ncbi:MAG: hypothetical protein EXQ96_03930 [Alphaproteobacteria bacterium]|nr:hypothetical protein [Alphaproteobacteria bacterium]